MTNQIKNFFSVAFSVIAVIAMGFGLYYLEDYGWDVSKYYFIAGGVLSIISLFIDWTNPQNYDNNDF